MTSSSTISLVWFWISLGYKWPHGRCMSLWDSDLDPICCTPNYCLCVPIEQVGRIIFVGQTCLDRYTVAHQAVYMPCETTIWSEYNVRNDAKKKFEDILG